MSLKPAWGQRCLLCNILPFSGSEWTGTVEFIDSDDEFTYGRLDTSDGACLYVAIPVMNFVCDAGTQLPVFIRRARMTRGQCGAPVLLIISAVIGDKEFVVGRALPMQLAELSCEYLANARRDGWISEGWDEGRLPVQGSHILVRNAHTGARAHKQHHVMFTVTGVLEVEVGEPDDLGRPKGRAVQGFVEGRDEHSIGGKQAAVTAWAPRGPHTLWRGMTYPLRVDECQWAVDSNGEHVLVVIRGECCPAWDDPIPVACDTMGEPLPKVQVIDAYKLLDNEPLGGGRHARQLDDEDDGGSPCQFRCIIGPDGRARIRHTVVFVEDEDMQ